MNAVIQSLVLTICTVVVGISMTLGAYLLRGFARHRLRAWNIYFALSVAALGFVRFAENATGEQHAIPILVVWGNLAVVSVVGLVGVWQLAKRDPPISSDHQQRVKEGA